ncbi:MAG: flagellar basal body P-ring formation protein FlgA [Rhodospirillales bacterium]|nr:flagellar basal body P-ring formation protein FlgA [Rhodospirillales bacterium]
MIRTAIALALAAGIAFAAASTAAGGESRQNQNKDPDGRPAAGLSGVGASASGGITLTGPSVTVNDPLVRLGDVFAGADARTAATAVAYAPQPGKRLVLDAQWLTRTARRHNLAWQPAGPGEHLVVQRQSFVVTREDVEGRVRAQLAERMPGTDLAVELFNVNFRLHAAGDANDTFAIEDLSFDAVTRRFEAIIAAPAGSTMAQRARVSGRVHKMIAVPVPKRPISKGEILRADDLEIARLKMDQTPADIAAARDALVGKAAVRGLRAGHPIFARDVERPLLVSKDSLVTLILQAAHMRLTARGKALDAGSKGDVIRIVNEQSTQVVEGTVVAAGQVAVKPFGAVADARPATN